MEVQLFIALIRVNDKLYLEMIDYGKVMLEAHVEFYLLSQVLHI